MFRGISAISLDNKGRLAMPARYRADLQASCEGQLVITLALDDKCLGEPGCLWLYPLPEWEAVEQKIKKLPTLNKMARNLQRFLIGYATECEMDAQGRFLVPEKLREFAGLEKQVILLGQLNKFEIWSDAVWSAKEAAWLHAEQDDEGLEELKSLAF